MGNLGPISSFGKGETGELILLILYCIMRPRVIQRNNRVTQ